MICVTGNERTTRQLAARLTRTADAAAMHELRLDRLERIDDDALALAAQARSAIVVCRPQRQGGGFSGSEGERLAILGRAAARWIDVEADVPEDALGSIARERLLLSWHDFEGVPGDLEARVASLAARRPGAIKIAVAVSDACQLLELQRLRRDASIPTVLIGMGEAGLLSRSHYAGFGSPWCYVAGDAAHATAPGQLTLARALALGLPASARAPVCGLAGGSQVMTSPGPDVYNRWLRAHGLPHSYVPIVTERLAPTLALCERLGCVGLSVTMPLKREALALSRPDALARTAGAVNTLVRQDDRWLGSNSDVAGVREPLRAVVVELGLQRALVLGAGGAARAAVLACRELGLSVGVSARREEAAAALGADRVIAWDERAADAHDLIVNATPLAGDESPWPRAPLRCRLAFDLAMSRERSRFLAQAEREGARALGPLAMWVHQGAEQLRRFFGVEADAHELETLLGEVT